MASGLFLQVLACFVLSIEHNQRLFGQLQHPSAIVSHDEAVERLRQLDMLRDSSEAQLLNILRAVCEWDLAFSLSSSEQMLYGQSGYLFPSLRERGELLLVPDTRTLSLEHRWMGEQVCVFVE